MLGLVHSGQWLKANIYAQSELLRRHSMICLCIWWDHWLWLCVFEVVHQKCCFPLEQKPFLRLTVTYTLCKHINQEVDKELIHHAHMSTRRVILKILHHDCIMLVDLLDTLLYTLGSVDLTKFPRVYTCNNSNCIWHKC